MVVPGASNNLYGGSGLADVTGRGGASQHHAALFHLSILKLVLRQVNQMTPVKVSMKKPLGWNIERECTFRKKLLVAKLLVDLI